MFAHELQALRMPLQDPSGRGYDEEFFRTEVCIYVGQRYCSRLKRRVVSYSRGVPSHELPLWYKLFEWAQNGYREDWPVAREVWDFGYYQLVDEWLRSQGIRRLPFHTRWLRNALHRRRMYLGRESAVPLPGLSLGPPASGHGTGMLHADVSDQSVSYQESEAAQEEALHYDDALEEAEVEQDVEAEEEEASEYDEALQYDEEVEEAELDQDVPGCGDELAGAELKQCQDEEPLALEWSRPEVEQDVLGHDHLACRGSVAQAVRLQLKRERTEIEYDDSAPRRLPCRCIVQSSCLRLKRQRMETEDRPVSCGSLRRRTWWY